MEWWVDHFDTVNELNNYRLKIRLAALEPKGSILTWKFLVSVKTHEMDWVQMALFKLVLSLSIWKHSINFFPTKTALDDLANIVLAFKEVYLNGAVFKANCPSNPNPPLFGLGRGLAQNDDGP